MLRKPVVRVARELPRAARRNFGVSAPALASDPIQQLFVEKLREYGKKSGGDKLVEPSDDIQKELKSELLRIERIYGAKGRDMLSFPKFTFTEPKIDPISVQDK